MEIHKVTGVPLAEDLDTAADLPHTLSFAVLYRERLDSFNELPKDKRPPRNLWDKPYALQQYFDTLWDDKKPDEGQGQNFYDISDEDVE